MAAAPQLKAAATALAHLAPGEYRHSPSKAAARAQRQGGWHARRRSSRSRRLDCICLHAKPPSNSHLSLTLTSAAGSKLSATGEAATCKVTFSGGLCLRCQRAKVAAPRYAPVRRQSHRDESRLRPCAPLPAFRGSLGRQPSLCFIPSRLYAVNGVHFEPRKAPPQAATAWQGQTRAQSPEEPVRGYKATLCRCSCLNHRQ